MGFRTWSLTIIYQHLQSRIAVCVRSDLAFRGPIFVTTPAVVDIRPWVFVAYCFLAGPRACQDARQERVYTIPKEIKTRI